MKRSRLKFLLIAPVVAFALLYVTMAVLLMLDDEPIPIYDQPPTQYRTIAIFGASGTAGDGMLKAALANPEIDRIHVVTRRSTPRIEAGVAMGRVEMTTHMDYLDYQDIEAKMANVDAVYWAIGIASYKVDDDTYGRIHVDFPARFVASWLAVSQRPAISFHYISSSDISEDSRAHWAREKMRAEKTLFALAEGSKLRVIAYRPDYIGPTEEQAHIGQDLLYAFFAPLGVAVRAEAIGKAMFEISARMDQFENGDRVGTRTIDRFANAFDRRVDPR